MTRRKRDDRPSGPIKPRLRRDGVEGAIQQAQREGEFDDLPGKGEPLKGLGEVYDPAWWAKKLVQRENVNVLPPALEVRRKLERLRAELPNLRDERRARERLEALDAEIAKVNRTATSGPATSVPRIDVEAELDSWRAAKEPSE